MTTHHRAGGHMAAHDYEIEEALEILPSHDYEQGRKNPE